MYSTCLFCNKPLGQNDALESFPVGRRLAFDAAKGRLWVVCPHCERWNLSPLEERWEAIEQAEGLYSGTRRRVSTDNIGLAKLRDGTALVRIGQPLRPEFAAWRYGDQFGRRRRRQLLIAGGGVAALGAVVVGGAVGGVGIGGIGYGLARLGQVIIHGNPEQVVAKIPTDTGTVLHVRRRHLAESSLSHDAYGQLAIDLRFKNGSRRFVGREAERIAAVVIPKVNRFGGSKQGIADAVREIEQIGSAKGYIERVVQTSIAYTRPKPQPRSRWLGQSKWNGDRSYGLFGLPATQRLALEMALHEEAERRALEGELTELERAWRDAEEIAAISDDMFVPSSVTATIHRLRAE